MPGIQIHRFIAYLTYNNNHGVYPFEEVRAGFQPLKKAQIGYAEDGAAIFYLRQASFKKNSTITKYCKKN